MRLADWFGRRRDADIDEEIASHLQMAIRDRVNDGEPPDEARRRALIEFGSPTLVKERTRAVWAWTALEQLAIDLQTGVRILWRAPALSATAIALIALVIGGNTTVFSMVHGVLGKAAPGVAADRLVTLGWVTDGDEHPGCSYPDYVDVAAASRTVRPMLATAFERLIVTTEDGSYSVQGAAVSTNYFDTVGVPMALGRSFNEDEARSGAGLAVVISDHLWREHFAAAADIVGRTTLINSHLATIVGVAPREFRGLLFAEGSEVWAPLAAYGELEHRQQMNERRAAFVIAIGRLAPGVSFGEAQAELATIVKRLPVDPALRGRNRTIQLFRYSATAAGDSLVAQRGPWFLALFSIVTALTLLIVCANVANLMLARAVVRAREMAVRQSFGASRARIVRIFVAEALAIALAAWAAAALFAVWTTHTIPRLIPPLDGGPSRISWDFSPDWRVLGYAMILALAGMAIVAAAPAARTCRQDLQPLLQSGGHGVVAGRSGISSTLVVLQLALSIILLTAAGLAYRSLSALDASDLGFDRSRLFLVTVNTKAAAPTPAANAALLSAMLDRLRAVPAVAAASYARRPLQSFWMSARVAEGTRAAMVERNEVGPGYFSVFGVTPRAGHDIASGDGDSAGIPAVVNARLAETLWPGLPPIGRTLAVAGYDRPVVVAGVVPDGFYNGYRRETNPNFVLVSAAKAPPPTGEITIYVKYSGALDAVVPAVGRALRDVNDRAPIVYQRTLDDQLEGLTWPIHALTVLLTLFAIGSLAIAAIGQYAAMSFTMRRRIRDFGVRMALGASAHQIVRSVVVEGLRLTAVGLAIGLAMSLAVGRGLQSLLFGVRPTDAPTYAGVVALLAAASLVACYLPAQRAARIDPMQALREE